MNPVSILHEDMSVKFMHPEFDGFYFSIQSTEQQKSSSSDSRNTEILIKLSLVDSFDSESSDRDQMSDPSKYCEKDAGIKEEHY